jgi:hypothetical protein
LHYGAGTSRESLGARVAVGNEIGSIQVGAGSRMGQARLTETPKQGKTPCFLFDLDGTLLDSAYEHVMAWREALIEEGIYIPNARIHRCVGMSGKLMLRTIFRERGRRISRHQIKRLEAIHKTRFERRLKSIRVLPGACELLKYLTRLTACGESQHFVFVT